ncbi:hypothetical protein [Nocardia tenerifensis]|uniref:hypothetical protein n=1 Tax=Nocardia tenerifensis TaxID=228006 RepID=UPI0011B4258E|nr:hypothetical protein [Nocardia tenerifensis]
MLSRTSTSRRLTRIAVAGALIALPLGALAATASAETPDPAAIQLTPAEPDGADISAHPHGGPDWLPGGGPRVEHRDGPNHHRGDGPRIYRNDEPGPAIFFKDGRPSTGSAGSS